MRYSIICAALFGLCTLSSCDLGEESAKYEPQPATRVEPSTRDQVESVFLAEVGVKEATGNNDGARVEQYLASTGLKKGNPWCAAFVSWCLDQKNVQNPHSAWSPDWFKANVVYQKGRSKVSTPQKGDVFGIWFSSLDRVAHVGFVQRWDGEYVDTVEGNSNDEGGREGDGVYRKRRLTAQIYAVSSWIK